MSHCFARRLPLAGLDRIDGPVSALDLLRLAIGFPSAPDTAVLLLDQARCGLALGVVRGTRRPDDVLEVVELFSHAAADHDKADALVVASVRPGAPGPDPDDVDRWLEMSDVADLVGIDLVEWFVVGCGTWCPRDLLGEPPRWRP